MLVSSHLPGTPGSVANGYYSGAFAFDDHFLLFASTNNDIDYNLGFTSQQALSGELDWHWGFDEFSGFEVGALTYQEINNQIYVSACL